jgi:hypothetical protein
MEATAYLDSLSIPYRSLTKTCVGRLAIAGEFFLENTRGIIVRPKRGGISGRYLDLLAAEGLGFIVVDSQPFLQIYGRAERGDALEQIRALPIRDPNLFPTSDVFRLIVDRLRSEFRPGEDALALGAALLAEKINDEQRLEKRFGPALVSPQCSVQESDILRDARASHGAVSAQETEAVLSAAAMLSGYRLTPETSVETAILLDGLAGFLKMPQQVAGLPESFAFAFTGPWTSGSRTLVISRGPGSQLLALRGNSQGIAVLPPSLSGASVLLTKLFPESTVLTADFLEWEPKDAPDRVVVVPPMGGNVSSPSILDRFTLASRDGKRLARAAEEVLYIEHAVRIAAPGAIVAIVVPDGLLSNMSHADFRTWLLEQGRLLAVISLPPARCFQGTAACCSLLYFQKVQPVPPDYSILMMEIQEDELANMEGRSELQKAIDSTLTGELSACA